MRRQTLGNKIFRFEEAPLTAAVSLQEVVSGMDLQSDVSHAFLNQVTGEVIIINDEEIDMAEGSALVDDAPEWQQDVLRKTIEVLNSDDYIRLPSQFEIHEYHIMEDFCYSIQDTHLQDELLQAIRGSGAFRRFKNTIQRRGIEDRWYAFRQQAFEEIAIDWLDVHGIAYTRDA